MKTVKKGLALLISLVMVLSLTACGSLSAAKTIRKTMSAESCHADFRADVSLHLGMMEESIADLNITLDGSGDLTGEPLRGAGDFRMEMIDETVDGRYYFVQEGDTLYLYSSPDGEDWSVSTVDLQDGLHGGFIRVGIEVCRNRFSLAPFRDADQQRGLACRGLLQFQTDRSRIGITGILADTYRLSFSGYKFALS